MIPKKNNNGIHVKFTNKGVEILFIDAKLKSAAISLCFERNETWKGVLVCLFVFCFVFFLFFEMNWNNLFILRKFNILAVVF